MFKTMGVHLVGGASFTTLLGAYDSVRRLNSTRIDVPANQFQPPCAASTRQVS